MPDDRPRFIPSLLGQLKDVLIGGRPTDGDALVWNDSAGKWEPGSAGELPPDWHHESFVVPATPPTTFTTALAPLTAGSLMLAQTSGSSSLFLDEGNDYTVDYTTGAITVSASLAAGDILVTRYQTPAGAEPVVTSVPNLIFWWRADTLGLSDGNTVSAWADEVASYSASQGSSSLRPIYRAAPTGFNGKPAVQFDGTDDYLSVGYQAGLNPAAFSYFVVYNKATHTGSQHTFSSRDLTGPDAGYDHFAGNGNGNTSAHVYGSNGGISADTGSSLSANTTYIAVGTDDGSTLKGYLSGTLEQTNASGAYTANTHSDFVIGSNYPDFGSSTYFNGWVAEIIGYSRVLTTSERDQVVTYLSTKYAI